MYDNIDKKIKTLALCIFGIGMSCSIFFGFLLCICGIANVAFLFFGVFLMIFGPLISWVNSWITYGFGELIEKVNSIERNHRREAEAVQNESKDRLDMMIKLETLRANGTITAEEYEEYFKTISKHSKEK